MSGRLGACQPPPPYQSHARCGPSDGIDSGAGLGRAANSPSLNGSRPNDVPICRTRHPPAGSSEATHVKRSRSGFSRE